MNKSADNYFIEGCGRCALGGTPDCKVHTWNAELARLRAIILETGLTETCKWGVPCYTFEGKNILMLGAFKENCIVSFFKGSLLRDDKKLLAKAGPNTQAAKRFECQSIEAVNAIESDIKAYIFEAIEVEKAGLKVAFKKDKPTIPEELAAKFEDDPTFKHAFEALTPGRQRGYLLHFSEAKQSKTRISRIEKAVPLILSGIGLHDKYKSRKK